MAVSGQRVDDRSELPHDWRRGDRPRDFPLPKGQYGLLTSWSQQDPFQVDILAAPKITLDRDTSLIAKTTSQVGTPLLLFDLRFNPKCRRPNKRSSRSYDRRSSDRRTAGRRRQHTRFYA
jgi:hypothetical protein